MVGASNHLIGPHRHVQTILLLSFFSPCKANSQQYPLRVESTSWPFQDKETLMMSSGSLFYGVSMVGRPHKK